MKRLIILVCLIVSLPACAQRLKVHKVDVYSLDAVPELSPDINRHLYDAGVSLQRSANYEMMTWLLAGISVYSFATPDKEGMSKTVGYVSAACAITAKIISVSYKHKAGAQLSLSAGGLSLTF